LIASHDSTNHLAGVDRLANTFSIMRHGQSMANVAGIIVSCLENDRRGEHGLSEIGRKQALETAQACGLPRDTIICSSDFSRARQTAEIVRAHLDAPQVHLAEALRERCFGEWEGSATDNYARVWATDETHSAQVGSGVEPVAAVLDRTTALIVELERRYSGRHILLVSHGDTLQILQAGFLRMSPSRHRSLPDLGTAEIRPLYLGGEATTISSADTSSKHTLVVRVKRRRVSYACGHRVILEQAEWMPCRVEHDPDVLLGLDVGQGCADGDSPAHCLVQVCYSDV
jgi:broad specificity phosphatase PhoE